MRLSNKVGIGFMTAGFLLALFGRLLLSDEQFVGFQKIVFPILIVGVGISVTVLRFRENKRKRD